MVIPGSRKDNFRCDQCGNCCIQPKIRIEESDVKRIESHGIARNYFLDKHEYMKKPKGACVFLRKMGNLYLCTIQDFKPDICKRWPFRTISILGKKIAYVSTNLDCPALKR